MDMKKFQCWVMNFLRVKFLWPFYTRECELVACVGGYCFPTCCCLQTSPLWPTKCLNGSWRVGRTWWIQRMSLPLWLPPIHSGFMHCPIDTSDAWSILKEWSRLWPSHVSSSAEFHLGFLQWLVRPHQDKSHIPMRLYLLQSSREYSPWKLLSIW